MIIRPEEWISEPDDDGTGLLTAWMEDGTVEFPIPIETHNVKLEDVKIGEAQDFDFIFECADTPEVYEDEDSYNNNAKYSMASESVIPIGTVFEFFSDFVPQITINGKVIKTYEDPTMFGFDDTEILYTFSCLGNEYDAVLHEELSNGAVIKEGNIISCVYWVQGWPKDQEESM